MRIQHQLGADIMFAFDECTTLMNTRGYQEQSVQRTHAWARALPRRARRLTASARDQPYQALFGVVQGAQYEDLRRQAARDLAGLEVDGRSFDGFGIGGALEKENLGTIVGWVSEELPEDRPRHLLGISEPDDLFAAIAARGRHLRLRVPSRVARNAALYTRDGRFNVNTARAPPGLRAARRPAATATPARTTPGPTCTTCSRPRRCSPPRCRTIHNERFTVRLVDDIRASIEAGDFDAFRTEFLGRFYASRR